MPRQGSPASSTRVEPGRSLNPTALVPAASREDLGLPRRTGPPPGTTVWEGKGLCALAGLGPGSGQPRSPRPPEWVLVTS